MITIYKIIDTIRWGSDPTSASSRVKNSCDLSNYYTKTELQGYHTSRVHYSNIVYDGRMVSYIMGEAYVTGRLLKRGGAVSIVNGIATVTGRLQKQGVLFGTTSGIATVVGSLYLWYPSTGEAYTFDMSIEEDSANVVKLVGDEDTPGNDYFYGTDGSGIKGWYELPSNNMVYPGVGVAVSTGSAWTTSLSATNLSSLAGLTYASLSFVKMSAAGTFSLDTATYSASSHNHDSDYISVVSTPTEGNFPTLTAGGELQNSTYNNASFATSGHNHSGVYEPAFSKSTGYLTWTGSDWSFVNQTYSISTHDHSGTYQPSNTNLTSLSNLTYVSASFVKMTAAGTFSLDTSTYASGTHNHDSDYISIVSTPTAGNFPILTVGGELENSSYNSSSFATAGHTHTNMVDYTGSSADNYIAVFTDTNTIEGTSGLTYNGSTLSITGTVTSTGDMTATNFCQSSDIRQKTNVNCYCNAPRLKIDYQSFELKSAPGVIRYGAIAQEVQKDYPELVRVGEDGMLTIAYIDLLVREVAYLKRKIREYQDIFDVD